MKQTITALWHGEQDRLDCFSTTNADIEDYAQKKISKALTLERMLQDEAKEVFDSYCSYANLYAVSLAEQAFESGFSLAVRLMTEALQDDKK